MPNDMPGTQHVSIIRALQQPVSRQLSRVVWTQDPDRQYLAQVRHHRVQGSPSMQTLRV